MLKQTVALIICFVLMGCNHEFENNNKEYDIIIIAGQSNTHQGLGLDNAIDFPDDHIFQLGRYSIYNHVITQATEPLQHHTSDTQRIGFGLTFAKLYKQTENSEKHPILLIPCGYGGSSLKEDWKPENFLYTDMINRVHFIRNKYPKSKLKVVLWHQGESDVGSKNYAQLLDQFIKQTRIDLGEELPFIVGGMVPYWVSQDESRVQQQNILKETPNRVSNTGYANPEIPFVITKENNDFDAVHYDAKGQRELGKRYFSVYQELIK